MFQGVFCEVLDFREAHRPTTERHHVPASSPLPVSGFVPVFVRHCQVQIVRDRPCLVHIARVDFGWRWRYSDSASAMLLDKQTKWIGESEAKIYALLEETQPNGKHFAAYVKVSNASDLLVLLKGYCALRMTWSLITVGCVFLRKPICIVNLTAGTIFCFPCRNCLFRYTALPFFSRIWMHTQYKIVLSYETIGWRLFHCTGTTLQMPCA